MQPIQTYLVGGAVRDRLLGRAKNKDKDWLVVGANPNYFLDKGFKQVGKDFPVFIHPDTKEEYALARTEKKSGSGYTGFQVDFNESITLEQDLLRRDITINAIAQDQNFNLIDPFNGLRDLKNRIIRHVSPAFVEDPLRVLRIARFYAELSPWKFKLAEETKALITQMSETCLGELTLERVWLEFKKALVSPKPSKFIGLLNSTGALKVLLPEIEKLYKVPENPKYHPEKLTGKHIELVLDEGIKLTNDPDIMFGLLVHDIGKGLTSKKFLPHHPNHEMKGVKLVENISKKFKLPRCAAQTAKIVTGFHGIVHNCTNWINNISKNNDDKIIEFATEMVNLLNSIDYFRKPKRLDKLLIACEADFKGRLGYANRQYKPRKFVSELANFLQSKKITVDENIEKQKIKDYIFKSKVELTAHFIKSYIKSQ